MARNSAPKLTEPEKITILTALAEFLPVSKILMLVKEKHGKEISRQAVSHYKTNESLRPLIEQYRQQYAQYLAEVPIFHKRWRLDRLQEQFQDVEQETYEDHLKRQEMREILSQVRNELEGKNVTENNTNILSIQYTSLSYEQLVAKRDELLTRIKEEGGLRSIKQEQESE